MKCVCGGEFEGTSTNPWAWATYDDKGKVIEGRCVHGIYMNLKEEKTKENKDGS
jgi:hypothetical protein